MLKLEDLKKDAQIRGLEGNKIVQVVSVEPIGDTAEIITVSLLKSDPHPTCRLNVADGTYST